MISVVFCELQVKMVVFGNLELKRRSGRKLEATSRCSNVVTSQHLINGEKSTSDPTSRCLNVATSLQFLPQNHKKQWKPNFEASKNVWTRVRKAEQQRIGSLEKTLSFVFLLF